VRSAAAERSNVALLNDRYVLKMFRRLEPGPHPEVELGRLFVEQGFSRTAPLAGSIEYDRPGDEPATIALVEAAVKHQGSGWEYSINDLQRYFESVAARVGRSDGPKALDAQDHEPSPFFLALERWYLTAATTLGRRTAEMHLTLLEGTGSAFAPEPMTRADVDRLAGAMRAQAEASLDLLQHRMASLGDATRAQAEALLDVRDALTSRFDHMRGVASAGLRMRVHGDYHLGQVLRTEEDFVIIDFEGEPGRPLSQRRAKQSPLKDVGGMVRSFGHAAYAALFGFAVHAPEDAAALEPWADTWQRWSAEAFLTAYRSAIASATTDVAPVPQDDGSFTSMLHAFVLDKTCGELTYELNNRPEWVRIPLAGLLKLATRLQS
jgi:maltose alpha-D-glucosyltransferase / alpha-amylase